MPETIDLRVAELLAARLCHDLISPIAAIGNGVELLGDEDPDFAADAVRLVGESAVKASRRLQFLRFAYGFTGSGLAGAAPYQLVRDLFADTAIVCDYPEALRNEPLDRQKLACNMALVAGEGLPRGGRVELRIDGPGLVAEAAGEGSGPDAEARRAITLETPVAELTSRSVGAYFAGVLARRIGFRLAAVDRPGGFKLTAGPGPLPG